MLAKLVVQLGVTKSHSIFRVKYSSVLIVDAVVTPLVSRLEVSKLCSITSKNSLNQGAVRCVK